MKMQHMIMAGALVVCGAVSVQAKFNPLDAGSGAGTIVLLQGPMVYNNFKVFVPEFKKALMNFQQADKTKKLVPFFAMLEMVMDRLEAGVGIADDIMGKVILNLIPDGKSFDQAKKVADGFHASKVIIDTLQAATKEMKMNLSAAPAGKKGQAAEEAQAKRKAEENKLEAEQLEGLSELEGLFTEE